MSLSTHYDVIIGTCPSGGTLAYKLVCREKKNLQLVSRQRIADEEGKVDAVS